MRGQGEFPAGDGLAYSEAGYTLHKRDVVLKGGKRQTIYFFARSLPKSGTPSELPEGYVVDQNPRTGLPYLKRA